MFQFYYSIKFLTSKLGYAYFFSQTSKLGYTDIDRTGHADADVSIIFNDNYLYFKY